MKPDPLHRIEQRIRSMSPFHKAAYLRGLIASEPKRGIRRQELEYMLCCVIQLTDQKGIKR